MFMSRSLLSYVVMALPAFVAAVSVAWLLVHTKDWHLHFTGDHPDSGPQKLHTEATSRIGGLAVMAGLLVGVAWVYFSGSPAVHAQLEALRPGALLAGLMPLFALGLVEDIRKSVSVRLRLGVSLAAGALAYVLAGVRVEALGLPFIDTLLHSLPVVSVLITLVAVAGLVHAMNIVDGLNGLLAGMTLVTLGVLAAVSFRFDEIALMLLAVVGMAATAGFAVFNFPRAKLFCGDAGAYLVGYLTAVIVILLVLRQPAISPWFALAVVMHPVTETLYSAWRRVRQGLHPTHPDARHMHSLWAANLQQHMDETGQPVWLGVNAGASWRTLAVACLPALLAATCPTQTTALQFICLAYAALFIVIVRLLDRPDDSEVSATLLSNDRL